MPTVRLTVYYKEVYSEQLDVDISDEEYLALRDEGISEEDIWLKYKRENYTEVDNSYQHESSEGSEAVAWEEL
tara:strand:- start:221 stop:439 length:219 start_codon:yes stop_codon:yes gene_type:complete